MITTKEFKTHHTLSDSTFTRLVKRVQTDYPDRPVTRKVTSQVWEVLEPELLASYIQKPKSQAESNESIEGEIVETHPLPNGSSLVFRSEAAPVPYVPPIEIKTEAKRIDFSGVDLLLDQLRSDIDSKRETEQLTKLVEFAQGCEAEKKQRDLVEMLISQGYTAEQAITIAQGAKNLTPVGK